jgi:hypothetical protein
VIYCSFLLGFILIFLAEMARQALPFILQEPNKDGFILRCQQVLLSHDQVAWRTVLTFMLLDVITADFLH